MANIFEGRDLTAESLGVNPQGLSVLRDTIEIEEEINIEALSDAERDKTLSVFNKTWESIYSEKPSFHFLDILSINGLTGSTMSEEYNKSIREIFKLDPDNYEKFKEGVAINDPEAIKHLNDFVEKYENKYMDWRYGKGHWNEYTKEELGDDALREGVSQNIIESFDIEYKNNSWESINFIPSIVFSLGILYFLFSKEILLSIRFIYEFIRVQLVKLTPLVLAIFVLFFILLLLFYWYEIRPANIRSQCIEELEKYNEFLYTKCLRENGIN